MNKLVAFLTFSFFLINVPVRAITIDFEAQGASAPSAFTGTLNSPLTIGIATFRGGQLLKNEAGGADLSVVYATSGGTPYLDPLTVTFSQPVSGFSLVVTNNVPDTYTVADNLGGSQSLALNANVAQIFNLGGAAITSVSISSATNVFWDFAIDNVIYSPVSAAVPEPTTLASLGGVLLSGVLLLLRRRHE